MTARTAGLLLVTLIVACTMRAGPPRQSVLALVVVPKGAPRPATTLPVAFAEVSAEPDARHLGLGGRDRLAPDSGMLFVYPSAEPRTYWMQGCLIPLDIAFLDRTRRVMNVVTLPAPPKGADDAQIARGASAGPSPYVLEMEAGWFERHDVRPGDEFDLSAALVGVDPR